MTFDYAVFPSEAILLGECLGEYEFCKGRFLDYVRLRLSPMLPSVLEQRSLCDSHGLVDDSHNYLVDVIFTELSDRLDESILDQVVGFGPDNERLRYSIEEYLSSERVENREQVQEFLAPSGNDDPKRIRQVLTSAVQSSGCEELFKVGCQFGSLIGGCREEFKFFTKIFGDHYPDLLEAGELPYSFQCISVSELEELAESAVLKSCGVAHVALLRLRDVLKVEIVGDSEDSVNRALDLLSRIESRLWMAFGELLGATREADLFARNDDAAKPTPRIYRVNAGDSQDAVRNALQNAERRLNEPNPSQGTAESIVVDLVCSIEALTKRLWPREGLRTTNIGSVLQTHIRSDKESVRRFASLSMSLYKSYRNSAIHDMDDFRCTLAEARLFAAAVRVLLDLCDQILRERRVA